MIFKKQISISSKLIGKKRIFIIAEIGSNHNQDIKTAQNLIQAAYNAGADAVKFQSIIPKKIYNLDDLNQEDLKLLESIKLQEDWYPKIRDFCEKKDILFFSAPTYIEAVDLLIKHGVKLIKIASPQTYGFPQLIKKIGDSGLPTLMSTGYCMYSEIERAVNVFKQTGNSNLILLHCISEYPTKPENVNLNFIKTLKRMFGTIVGFSDHSLGIHTALAAVAKGAKVIEKHLTLSRDSEGVDHYFAIEPEEFKELIDNIRDIEQNLGRMNKITLTEFEKNFKKEVEMKIVADKVIEKDEEITNNNISYLRNKIKIGVSAWDEKMVLGKKSKIKLNRNDLIEYKNLY